MSKLKNAIPHDFTITQIFVGKYPQNFSAMANFPLDPFNIYLPHLCEESKNWEKVGK